MNFLLKSLSERLFTCKEPYLTHLLRKLLGRLNRTYLRENLDKQDIIVYTDYSKGNISLIRVTGLPSIGYSTLVRVTLPSQGNTPRSG